MLVQQVDAICAKPSKRAFDGLPDVLGAAVEARPALASLKINVPAELRSDHNLVAKRLHRLTEDAFAFVRAVGLGAVEEGDTLVKGPAK